MKRWTAFTAVVVLGAVTTACAQTPTKIPSQIPSQILTPDEVETRLGKLEFFDGLPSTDTVEKAYDHLDFMRGVRAFLDGIPIASLYAMR